MTHMEEGGDIKEIYIIRKEKEMANFMCPCGWGMLPR